MPKSTVGYFYAHFLRNRPFEGIRSVVWVERKNEGRVTVASTASEYPLATFCRFRSLARNYKITCWDIPNPYAENGGGHG